MVKYFVEISKNADCRGKILWSPVNKKIWHWKILRDLSKGDVVYHISTEEKPPRLLGKSIVQSSVREIKMVLKEYPLYTKKQEVALSNFKKTKKPLLFDELFTNKLRKINFNKTKSPFNVHYHLNQVYCCEINKELMNFFEKVSN